MKFNWKSWIPALKGQRSAGELYKSLAQQKNLHVFNQTSNKMGLTLPVIDSVGRTWEMDIKWNAHYKKYLSIYLSVCLSICLSVCPSVRLFVYLSVCLPVCLSVCLSIYLSIYRGDWVLERMKRTTNNDFYLTLTSLPFHPLLPPLHHHPKIFGLFPMPACDQWWSAPG